MKAIVTALKVLVGLAALIAIGAYPAAWLLARGAVEVQQIRPYDDALVAFNQWEFEEGEWDSDIVSIYGSAEGESVEVLFVDEERLLHPKEDERLVLLPMESGQHVLQAKTVYYFAQLTAVGAAGAGLLGGLALWLARRRERRHGDTGGARGAAST